MTDFRSGFKRILVWASVQLDMPCAAAQISCCDSGADHSTELNARSFRIIRAEAHTRQNRAHEIGAADFRLEYTNAVTEDEASAMKTIASRVIAEVNTLLRPQLRRSLLVTIVDESYWPDPAAHAYAATTLACHKIVIRSKRAVIQADFESSMFHEYAHIVVRNLSTGFCPHWLDEGIAWHIQAHFGFREHARRPYAYLLSRRVLNESDRYNDLYYSTGDIDARCKYFDRVYAAQYCVASYVAHHGWDGLRRALRRTRSPCGHSTVQAEIVRTALRMNEIAGRG
jgi:hypothetical protein